MSKHPGDLRRAIIAIVRADVDQPGAVGVIDLLRSVAGAAAKPAKKCILEWGDPGMNQLPVVTLFFPTAPYGQGSADRLRPRVQLSVHLPRAAGDVGERVIARLEEILTQSALAAEGIDCCPWWKDQGNDPPLTEGEQRRDLEGEFWLNRT